MKKLVIIAAIAFFCCGCTDSTELGERAIVQLAAIDCDSGGYTLSALLFSSSGEIDAAQSNVIKVTGSGSTIGEAVEQLSLADGREVYMSEAKLLVLGGGFRQTDAASALAMLNRDMRCSLNTPVCFCENAELLADLEFTEGITSAQKPVNMIENACLSGVSPKATILDILSDNQGGRATLIPCFTEAENGRGITSSEDGKTAVLNGGIFISGGSLSRQINAAETAGYMLLSGKADSARLDITVNGKEYACEAYNIRVFKQDGKPAVTASFRSRTGGSLSPQQLEACSKRLAAIARSGMAYVS